MKPTLIELIRGFMEHAYDQGKKSFPGFCGSRPWHMFLYQTGAELGPKFPFLFDIVGNFDWDGPYPKSPRLSEIFPALIFISHVRYDLRLVLDRELKRPENPLAVNYPDLTREMFEIASQIPDFFIDE